MTRRCRFFFWTEIISTYFNHLIMILLYLAKLHQFVSRVLHWLCRCQCESVSPLSVCEVINVCEFPMELGGLNIQGPDQKAPQQPLNAAKYAHNWHNLYIYIISNVISCMTVWLLVVVQRNIYIYIYVEIPRKHLQQDECIYDIGLASSVT